MEDKENSGFCDVWLRRIPSICRVVCADHREVAALLRMREPRIEVQCIPIMNDAPFLLSLNYQSFVVHTFCN
jgi:hypothetical protein